MRFITSLFGSPGEFLASYSRNLPEGALFCPVRRDVEVDEDLLLEVWFPGLVNRALLRGTVAEIGRDAHTLIRLHGSDAHTRDFLLDVARGQVAPHKQVTRGHRRIPAAVPVSCRIDEIDEPSGTPVTGHTHDLGAGGAFVHAIEPPAVGTRVSMVLGPAPRTGQTFTVDGRVAWIRRDARAHGFGVKFDPRGEHDGPRLRTALRRSWESGRLDLA